MKTKKEDSAEIKKHQGEIVYGFPAPEFLDYPRGKVWYLVASIISIGILTITILTKAILLVLAFVIFVGVYWLLHRREARILEIEIAKLGIRIDGKFYPFREIKEFWFVYNPPFVADLKIKLKRNWNRIQTIHIFGQEPETLRQFLTPQLKEVEREEELGDLIIRALRL